MSGIPFVATLDPCLVPKADELYVRENAMELVTALLSRRGITLDPEGDEDTNDAFAEAIVAMWAMTDAVMERETYTAQWVLSMFSSLFETGKLHDLLNADDPEEFKDEMMRIAARVTQSLLVVQSVMGAAAIVLPSNEEYAMADNEESRCVQVGLSVPTDPNEQLSSLLLDENYLVTVEEMDAWDRFFASDDDE